MYAYLRTCLFILLLSVAAIPTVNGQSLPDSILQKIDSLYLRFTKPGTPGCAIGIVRNDSLIYSKGYGLANLEYNIPNTPATIYHMASISKQFTAWAILLLQQQGKLKVDDDVRKYLKWFPDLEEKITIRHLLNHTSGIRDQWQLLAISGTRMDDVIKQEHVVKILSKQNALNFKPGEKYSYSNSGFTMLAEIVRSVTGQTLRQFTDSAIFKPLGMTNTHFHDDYEEIEPNRAYSYGKKDSAHFTNAVLCYSNAGATSLFTNIPDLSKWIINFYTHQLGDQQLVDSLTKKGKLNTGKEISYASGIAIGSYRGWKQYEHGGADAGYRTYVNVFPDLKMGFMVFSNFAEVDAGGLVEGMMRLLIKDTTQKKETIAIKKDSTASILKDSLPWKKYQGHYISEDGLAFSFEIRDSKLWYQVYDEKNVLVKGQKDTFTIEVNPEIKFKFDIKGKDTSVIIKTPSEEYLLKKYTKDTTQTDAVLKPYIGTYYCPELDCKYGIELKDHRLTLTNNKYEDSKLVLVNSEHLTSDHWWISHFQMLRDGKNKITGFEVNSGRIMHLKFVKL